MVFTLVNLFAATNKIDLQNITQILFKVLFNKVYIQYALLHRLYTNSQLSFFNYWINCNVQQKFLCDPNYVLYVLQGLAGIAGAPGEPGRTGESGIPGPSGEPGEAGERVCIF
jgi:hypothetical protein